MIVGALLPLSMADERIFVKVTPYERNYFLFKKFSK